MSDRPLSDGDRVRLFSAAEIRSFMKVEREPAGSRADSKHPADRGPVDPAEAAVRSLMIEHAVIIHGAVRQPGSYPVDGQVRLETLLATAGPDGAGGCERDRDHQPGRPVRSRERWRASGGWFRFRRPME